jgi:hypothetical protein
MMVASNRVIGENGTNQIDLIVFNPDFPLGALAALFVTH